MARHSSRREQSYASFGQWASSPRHAPFLTETRGAAGAPVRLFQTWQTEAISDPGTPDLNFSR